jgi:SAM-dependent methyltransferase
LSNNFGLYSQYYDLLYQDKNYEAEAGYILEILKRYLPWNVSSLLELGSGTGIHAGIFAKAGIRVQGIELSISMLDKANERLKVKDGNLTFFKGDARSYRAGESFDAVVSLFHVFSYQITDFDLRAMITTAAVHLQAGGLFVFDFWYGPAVLSQGPSYRVKKWENDTVSIIRIAEPNLDATANTVDVNYTIFSTNNKTEITTKVSESHHMRYLFLLEVDTLLAEAGFSRVMAEEWMTGRYPSTETWSVCVAARKNS